MRRDEFDAYVHDCCDPRAEQPPWFALFVTVLCLVAGLLIHWAGVQ